MNILYLGSGEFGLCTLKWLASEHNVVGVVTSPDKPAGRKRMNRPTAIGKWANEEGLDVFKTEDVNSPEFIKKMDALQPDAVVVIAFGQKLSEEFIGTRPTINLHASLLPRWRGASPINAAIVRGDQVSGVSVITLSQKMDSGHILAQREVNIGEHETAGELHDRLALLGPEIVEEVLNGDFEGSKQDEAQVTYAPKISREDAKLDLTQGAVTITNEIRGYSPWPGCHISIAGIDCKILNAIPNKGDGDVGEILENGTIAVGEGSIEILQLKPAGSNSMSWKDFCNGHRIQTGDMCGVLK